MTTYPNATHYSEHFPRYELDCGKHPNRPKCECVTPPEVQRELALLAQDLETLRTIRGGHPMYVNCAYRCEKRNKLVGGAPHSFHKKGQAADIDAGGTDAGVDKLASDAEKVPSFKKAGIGKYYHGHGQFVHVDRGNRFWRGINGV